MKVYEFLGGRPGQIVKYFDDGFSRIFRLNQSPCVSIEDEWTPERMKITWNSQQIIKCMEYYDFPAPYPLISARAATELGDIWKTSGELLSMVCDEGEYYFFNLLIMIDALDKNLTITRKMMRSNIFEIEKYEFIAEKLQGALVFKIPEDPAAVFITDRFLERVKDSKLTGLDPILVWSSAGEEDFVKPPSGSSRSIGEILALPSQERLDAFRERLIDRWAHGDESLEAFSEAEQTLFLVDEFETMVGFDGLDEFLYNGGGRVSETLKALRRIGADQSAALLEAALEPFGKGGPPKEDEARQRQIDAMGAGAFGLWDRLGDELMEYPDRLPELEDRYIDAHRDQFR